MIETEFCEIPKVSLSHFVKRYMEIENMLISAFYKENDNAVYSCRMYFDDDGDGDWYNEPGIFASFDEAYKHALDDGGLRIRILWNSLRPILDTLGNKYL